MEAWVETFVYILEVIKFGVVSYWIIGLTPTKRKYRFAVIPVIAIMGGYTYISRQYSLIVDFLLLGIIILVWFHEKIRLSILSLIIEFLSISFIDLMMWLICVIMTPLGAYYPANELSVEIIANLTGLIPLLIMAYLMHRNHITLRKSLMEIRLVRYALIILIMLSMIVITTSLQGMFRGEITLEASRLIMISCIVLSFFIVALCVLYIYVADSRNKLAEINILNEECIEHQKNYYKSVMQKDEELRAFKHDVNKHISSLQILFQENKIDEIGEYLDSISTTMEMDYVYKTGNLIADYIINGKIKEIKEHSDLNVKIIGKFPPKVKLKNTEMCIVLANVLDNAKEAIMEFEGEKYLEVEIRNYQEKIYITIKNSSPKRVYKKGMSTKKDKENHGYGMRNVERIVDKYQGKLNIKWENNLFHTEIEI